MESSPLEDLALNFERRTWVLARLLRNPMTMGTTGDPAASIAPHKSVDHTHRPAVLGRPVKYAFTCFAQQFFARFFGKRIDRNNFVLFTGHISPCLNMNCHHHSSITRYQINWVRAISISARLPLADTVTCWASIGVQCRPSLLTLGQ